MLTDFVFFLNNKSHTNLLSIDKDVIDKWDILGKKAEEKNYDGNRETNMLRSSRGNESQTWHRKINIEKSQFVFAFIQFVKNVYGHDIWNGQTYKAWLKKVSIFFLSN